MMSFFKPSRALWLAVALSTFFMILVIGSNQGTASADSGPTGATGSTGTTGSTVPIITKKSYGCDRKLRKNNSSTWVCVRYSGPSEVVVGQTVQVKIAVRVRKKIGRSTFYYRDVLEGKKRVLKRFKRGVRKGRLIKATVSVSIPTDYLVANLNATPYSFNASYAFFEVRGPGAFISEWGTCIKQSLDVVCPE